MLATSKSVSIASLFGIAAFCGISACVSVKWLVQKFEESSHLKRIIGLMNCFSGGVFFATSVITLLPEARESMEECLNKLESDLEYPFTELAMSVGFLLIMALEHVSYTCCGTKQRAYTPVPGDTVSAKDEKIKHKAYANKVPVARSQAHQPISKQNEAVLVRDFEDSSGLDDVTYQNFGVVDESLDKTALRPCSSQSRNDTPNAVVVFAESDQIIIRKSKRDVQKPSLSAKDILHNIKHETDEHLKQSTIRGLVLLVALSLHMIFDGLAVGLLKSDDKVWSLFAALAVHKALVFITVGMQTYELLASIKKSIVVIIILALVSPMGILIGESISSSDESLTRDMFSAILQGIATGTFLFVTFFEILQHELGSNDHDVLKVIMVILGVVLVAGIRVLEHEDH